MLSAKIYRHPLQIITNDAKLMKILFSHIPKTAGTSFRKGLEEAFNKEQIFLDYKAHSPKTNSEIRKFVYGTSRANLARLTELVESREKLVLAGHFPLSKYSSIFQVMNMVTFVREPVARILSEYDHARRIENYDGTIDQFIHEPRNINKQTNYLKNIPLPSIGLVGITERYDESLLLLLDVLDITIPKFEVNRAPSVSHENDEIDDELLNTIRATNKKDLQLYDLCLALHKIRLELRRENKPLTFGGFQFVPTTNSLCGFAFRANRIEPLEIEIFSANQKIGSSIANEFYHPYPDALIHCREKVGFSFQLQASQSANKVQCRVKDTQQLLLGF